MNCYKVLGLSRGATQAQIKKAHRKLVIDLHPDKGGDPDRFREVQEAYETLSDPKRKAFYDKYGISDENKLIGLFGKLVQECIGQGAVAGSLIDRIDLKIEASVRELAARAEKIAKYKNILTESLGTVKMNGEGDDLVSWGIKANLEQVNLELKQAEDTLALMKAAESVMENYESGETPEVLRFNIGRVETTTGQL